MIVRLNQAHVYRDGHFVQTDRSITVSSPCDGVSVSISNCYLLPTLVDVHVHLREPGFLYKETIATGTLAAAHGGYSDVCSMPNLNPTPDCPANLAPQLEAIEKDAVIRVHPYGTLTVGEHGKELADLEGLAPHVCAFSDDGRGVQLDDMMRAAMLECKRLGKIVAAHCEDNTLLKGGYIHDGEYAKAHGHRGICSESEWGQIARDLKLVKETGCAYHVCHISTKESVELIRQAKIEGLDVTCETGPHYLILSDKDLQEDGRFKMNPPLRGEEDKKALLEGLIDGTIDMIATDHAPHSADEKSRGLEKSAMGIVGLETAFPLLYTYLVKPGIITLEKLVEVMAINPRKRFGLPLNENDFTLWELDTPYAIDPETFLSMGRATPFTGWEVYGRNKMTVLDSKVVWQENN